MAVLITGGAGYIGSHIAEKLCKKKDKVIIFDNLVTGYKYLLNKKAHFIHGDIKNFNFIKKVIQEQKITSIIHMAAYLSVSEAESNKKKYYKNNVLGTLNLIKACKKSLVKNIIFSSSCSVYGNVKGSVSEIKKANPVGYYAYTKFKSEEIIKKYEKKFNYKYAILRYFNVAGASSSRKIGQIEKSHGHLIKNLSIASLKRKPIVKIFGNDYKTKDGTCIRDYIHVSDLTDIHLKSLKFVSQKKKSIILNCGYGKGISVLDVVKELQKIKKINIKIIYTKRRPGDIEQIYANTKKLKKYLKWSPKFNSIKKMITSSIIWEKKILKLKRL